MKIWVDDVRPAPEGYVWLKSVNQVQWAIRAFISVDEEIGLPDEAFKYLKEHGYTGDYSAWYDYNIEVIDLDHDAGDYASDGGDYIKILDWFEELGLKYPIHIHSKNPVGIENMRRIIQRNGWEEV
jgi:hypothetical protein